MKTNDVLEKLCLTPAPSGYEKEAAQAFYDLMKPYADEIKLDRMGNVIVLCKGTEPDDSPRLMAFAHLDQLGFIVRKIEKNGFIRVDRLGGIPEKVLPGLRIVIRNKEGSFISGFFGNKSHHASSPEEKYKVDYVTDLYVDIGARNEQEVLAKGIDVGCPAVYEPYFKNLGNSIVSGTAIDNRGGLTALILAAKELKSKKHESDIFLVGTVWEEFNIRGAAFAARKIKPDFAICIDVILAGDTEDLSARYSNKVGDGPTINYYSFHGRGTLNGTLPHEGLVRLMEEIAIEEAYPYQKFASLGILTDSAYVQMENDGIACADMGFPTRYTHTPVETCSLTDIEVLGEWLSKILCKLNKHSDYYRYRIKF